MLTFRDTHLVKYRREAENNDGDGPLVIYDELPEGSVVVANRLLDFAHRPVHLLLPSNEVHRFYG